jgi:AraC family transcriptional regulator
MKPEPVLETLTEKMLIGKRIQMSFSDNKTFELWRNFMPIRKEIRNNVGADLFSLQVFDPLFFENFDPNAEFEKWAAIEVTDFHHVPEGMEAFTLKAGLYAVFNYKGSASEGAATFQYIYGTWIPNSEYSLDDRPHFEILGEKYKNEDPDSEETIWIPIKPLL